MENKSRLPTMIKKPATARAHVPSDRMVHTANVANKTVIVPGSKAPNRPALTSFENVVNNLRNPPTNRPTKRHASPEAFRTKAQVVAAKKLRRSRSVSDIESVLSLVNVQKRTGKDFALPLGPAPRTQAVKVPYALPKFSKPSASVVKPPILPSSKTQPLPPQKKNISAATAPTTKKEIVPKKVTGGSSGGVGGNKKIPSYDFKARYHDLLEKHKVLKNKHERLREQLGEFESLPEQYDECRAKLSDLESEYQCIQQQVTTLQQQHNEDQEEIKKLNDDLIEKIEECRTLFEAKQKITEKYKTVSMENDELKTNNSELETKLKSQQEMIEQLTTELEEAGEQLFRANIDRKELHNTVMDLRGNIRVFCRVRPPLEGEENRTICSWQYSDDTSLEIC